MPQVRFATWVLGLLFSSAHWFERVGLAMPAGLKRYYGKGHLHFITFSCYRRLPLLNSARARDTFVRELGRVRDELGFRLIGLCGNAGARASAAERAATGTPSTVLQKLKLRVARRLRRRKRRACAGQMRLPFQESVESLRAFWQARFYDFNVYSQGKKLEKLNYMHANPVKRGLVKHPKDWPWSSWRFYGGGLQGWLPSIWNERKKPPQDPGCKPNLGHPHVSSDSRK